MDELTNELSIKVTKAIFGEEFELYLVELSPQQSIEILPSNYGSILDESEALKDVKGKEKEYMDSLMEINKLTNKILLKKLKIMVRGVEAESFITKVEQEGLLQRAVEDAENTIDSKKKN